MSKLVCAVLIHSCWLRTGMFVNTKKHISLLISCYDLICIAYGRSKIFLESADVHFHGCIDPYATQIRSNRYHNRIIPRFCSGDYLIQSQLRRISKSRIFFEYVQANICFSDANEVKSNPKFKIFPDSHLNRKPKIKTS